MSLKHQSFVLGLHENKRKTQVSRAKLQQRNYGKCAAAINFHTARNFCAVKSEYFFGRFIFEIFVETRNL